MTSNSGPCAREQAIADADRVESDSLACIVGACRRASQERLEVGCICSFVLSDSNGGETRSSHFKHKE